MKTIKLISIFLLMILSNGCSLNSNKTDISLLNLKGNVKSYNEFSYEAIEKFGNIQKGDKIWISNLFDNIYMVFNENGNLIEAQYNSYGKLYKKLICKYDKKGNKIEENWYNSNGSLDEKSIIKYKYDKKGNVTEENRYHSDGSLDEKLIYKYDEKRNVTEENRYFSDGSLDRKIVNKYDKKGNIIEVIWNGSIELKHSYKYNENGDVIEFHTYNSDGSLYKKRTSKYEYDKLNNWIKKIEFKNEIPQIVVEREIEYFE